MVNMSLEEGRAPENCKLALLKPLLKKAGMDLLFENFRPVNNLPFVAKVTEKAVSSQLLNHCNILINMDNGEVTLIRCLLCLT